MGMPASVEIVDPQASLTDIAAVYDLFDAIDARFSTYKPDSEISRINRGLLPKEHWSEDMQAVMVGCEQTRQETGGYFDIRHGGRLDPSGYVKGWAIHQATRLLHGRGLTHFCLEIGGDLQAAGHGPSGRPWVAGIRNPLRPKEIIKRLSLDDTGLATSGSYLRGQHIHNPHQPGLSLTEIVSLSVVGPNILDADRYATAAFAMGTEGIGFIASLPGFEGYAINRKGVATYTPGLARYVLS